MMIYLYLKVGMIIFTLWMWLMFARQTEEAIQVLKNGGIIPFLLVTITFLIIWPLLVLFVVLSGIKQIITAIFGNKK
jgi:hypothetical protein